MTNENATSEIKLNEPILPDEYPVYCDYLYVCDGNVIRSDIEGTVRRMKVVYGAKEVRRCDIYGRQEIRKREMLSINGNKQED